MKFRNPFKIRNVTKAGNPEIVTLDQLVNFLNINGTEESALSEATYFACLKVLSESVGKLPLKLLQSDKRSGVREAKENPLYNLVRNRPNRFMNSTSFWSTIEQLRNHYGNAYVYISGFGKHLELVPLDSQKIQIYYDDAKLLSNIPDIWYVTNIGGTDYRFSSEEILHFKTSSSFDGIEGLSVREILKSTISGNQKAQKMQNDLYDSGFTAKAVVQYTGNLKDESAKVFLQNIEHYAKGKVDAGKGLIPIPLGSTFTPLNTKLGDNEFIELKKYSALQIANAFGLKPNQINDYSKSSYSSSEAQNLAFYTDTLLYILKQYEEELNYKLLTEEQIKQGYFFKFNVAVILRADLKTQIESLSKGVANGIYTPNEARNLLDLESKPGCDDIMCNGSNIKVKDIGIQYMDDTEENSNTEENEDEEDEETNQDLEGGEADEE